MEVFIHEDYVNKRNEVRREQRRRRQQQLPMLQVACNNNPDASRPAPTPRGGSPWSPAPTTCVTPSTVSVSPAPAEPPEHRLFDCLKPY